MINSIIDYHVLLAVNQRDEWERKKKMRVKRERGWTGNSWGGTSLGPPDPGPNGGKHSHSEETFNTTTEMIEKEEMGEVKEDKYKRSHKTVRWPFRTDKDENVTKVSSETTS